MSQPVILSVILISSVIYLSHQCPSQCVCSDQNGRHNVKCDGKDFDISKTTQTIPHTTHRIDITNNDVEILHESVFGFDTSVSVRELSISNSGITEIKHDAFRRFPNLEKLELNRNKIHTISNYAFSMLTQLTSLDLAYNRIPQLTETVFYRSSSLTKLSVSNNPISDINHKAFSRTNNLQYLNLSGCGLTRLSTDIIKPLSALTNLDISHNKLQNLSDDAIKQFDKLSVVAVHGNTWHCNCGISPLKNWLQSTTNSGKLTCSDVTVRCLSSVSTPRCSTPDNLKNKRITSITDEDTAQCEPRKEDNETSTIIIVVAAVFAVLALVATVSIIIYIKWQKQQQLTPSENGSAKPITMSQNGLNGMNGAFDLGSINESDRAFPLRNYMQTLDDLSGPFSSVNSESCHTTQNGSLSISSSQAVVIKRESAV